MRNAFADELLKIALEDPKVVMLSGDIGNRLFDEFKAKAPDRFFNCGVAEANLIGVAAGLAMDGFRPVAYTIVPFITARCLEQIRVDLCYHNLPVTVVGVGGGLSYASLGGTHHACEDLAMLRCLPEMNVYAPADAMEVRGCLRSALSHDAPAYVRIGKKREPVFHESIPACKPGGSVQLKEGADAVLLACGNILPVVMDAADALAKRGVHAAVHSAYGVKPLDTALLQTVFAKTSVVATIEEHTLVGGFGSAVAEWLVDRTAEGFAPAARLLRLGTGDRYLHEAGSQAYARTQYGLTPTAIADRVTEALRLAEKPATDPVVA
ncbi:MAG: transketolase C-terminal domain-containing protein [Planctomycetota bacterium]